MGWDNRASYVDIDGFDVDAAPLDARTQAPACAGPPASTAAVPTTASWPTTCTTSPSPPALHQQAAAPGIGVDSYYKGTHSEVTGNSVHDIGPPGCRYVQGIYVNTPATVRNNVVYRVAAAGIHLWHDAHEVVVVEQYGDGVEHRHRRRRRRLLSHPGAERPHPGGQQHRVRQPLRHLGTGRDGASTTATATTSCSPTRKATGIWPTACAQRHGDAAEPHFVSYARTAPPISAWRPDSPAIGKGFDDGDDGPDFHGKARPKEGVDIGACQH
jgi:hypothetical protein